MLVSYNMVKPPDGEARPLMSYYGSKHMYGGPEFYGDPPESRQSKFSDNNNNDVLFSSDPSHQLDHPPAAITAKKKYSQFKVWLHFIISGIVSVCVSRLESKQGLVVIKESSGNNFSYLHRATI